MSIADKQMLLNKVNELLCDKLSATELSATMKAISEELALYEVQSIKQQDSAMQSSEILDAFLTAKRTEGRTAKTIDRYNYCLAKFLKSVNVPVTSINVYHIRKYLDQEKKRGSADSTVEGCRCVLSAFFGWLTKEELIQRNPMNNVATIKCEKKVRKPYTDIDLEKLKEYCETDRNRAIMFFLLSTGCRISEMCELNRDDINYERKECVIHGKGNKWRTVFMSDVAAMMLKRYIDSRKDNSPALFSGKGTSRMTPGGVRFMLKTIAAKAGVEKCHPHRFRRTLATSLIKRGMAVQDVAFILGHEKLDTTMKYVYMEKEDVKYEYRKCV